MTRHIIWTKEKISILLDLLPKGWTRQEIADELGLTKSAIGNKIRRLRRSGIEIPPRHSIVLKRKWQDPEYRTRQISSYKSSKFHTLENKINAGKNSRLWENKKVKEIESQFGEMFYPSSICDRICLKDGKLIFVEIKRTKQKLRPNQEKFRNICKKLGIEYQVFYI